MEVTEAVVAVDEVRPATVVSNAVIRVVAAVKSVVAAFVLTLV